jgi:hypothetical protein
MWEDPGGERLCRRRSPVEPAVAGNGTGNACAEDCALSADTPYCNEEDGTCVVIIFHGIPGRHSGQKARERP